jgi:hypothetical protein
MLTRSKDFTVTTRGAEQGALASRCKRQSIANSSTASHDHHRRREPRGPAATRQSLESARFPSTPRHDANGVYIPLFYFCKIGRSK